MFLNLFRDWRLRCHGYLNTTQPAFLLAIDQETITILLSDNKATSLKQSSVDYAPHGEADEEKKVRTIRERDRGRWSVCLN